MNGGHKGGLTSAIHFTYLDFTVYASRADNAFFSGVVPGLAVVPEAAGYAVVKCGVKRRQDVVM